MSNWVVWLGPLANPTRDLSAQSMPVDRARDRLAYRIQCLLALVLTNIFALAKKKKKRFFVSVMATPVTTTKYIYYNRCYYNKNDYCGNIHPIVSFN